MQGNGCSLQEGLCERSQRDASCTWGAPVLDVADGGALCAGVQQEQQDGLQDPRHVAEGQRPDEPALSRRPDGPVRAVQAVQHHKQGPEGETSTKDS